MLGNKLLQLIKDLNTSERKLLIYKAKRSNDKRLTQIIRLLGEPNQSSAEFQESLMIVKNSISTKGQSEKIKNDLLRRFIDFCIKEIEDLKIENYSKKIIQYTKKNRFESANGKCSQHHAWSCIQFFRQKKKL